jgi:hypothetical protein
MLLLRYQLCSTFVLLAACLSGPSAAGETNGTHAAAVLLDNFETVFFAAPTMLSDSPDDVRSGFPREPFGFLFAGLDAVGPQFRTDLLDHSEAIFVGAKDFHPPLGLGRVQSTRCYIVVLGRNSKFQLAKYFKKAGVATAIKGAPVWYWSAELQEFGESDPRPSALFVAQIGESYILISNKLEEELGISEKLVSTSDDAKIFAEVQEWSEVKKHDFWGYRKYRHGATPDAIRRFDGTDHITPATEALIVYMDLKKQSGVLRLLSSNPKDSAPRNLDGTHLLPPFKPAGSAAWETAFPLTGGGQFADSANSVLWLFGWGVLV